MTRMATLLIRLLSVLVPIGLGALAIVLFAGMKSVPSAKENTPQATPVRVLTVAELPVTPRVTGYGSVTPSREWRAVARVEGEVVWTADTLQNGLLAAAGEELMRLDETDIRLALAQIDAQIAAIDVKDDTVRASLEIAEAEWAISKADLERQQGLAAEGVVSQTSVDQAVRQELSSRASVANQQNQLALNAAERAVLAAQRDSALRDLSFTSIRPPYDVRIGEVSAELGQYVSRGQVLVAAEGTDAVEIAAQFPIGRMRPLVGQIAQPVAGGTPAGLQATVRLQAPDRVITWPATVDRIGDLVDARTQSISVVVRVDQPLDQAQAGQRPPLRRNMFVEVDLRAPERAAIAVPGDAVRGGKALVVTGDGVLETRAVRVAYTLDWIAVISDGLAPGDKLVVSDVELAVPGKAVKPMEDKTLAARLAAAALGTDARK